MQRIFNFDWATIGKMGIILACVLAYTVYLVAATLASVVLPFSAVLFVLPFVLTILILVPQGRAVPKPIVMWLLYAGTVILPLWPVYVHLKLGPLPIITPPRLALYGLTAIWFLDMLRSPYRRGQFLVSMKRGTPLTYLVVAFFAVGALSIPMAEGRSMAAQEYIRQVLIWFLPFCIALTYIRRMREFRKLIVLLTIAAGINAAIAVVEKLTGTLLAGVLSPFITGNAEWLQIAKSQKIRDGVFRAQATHTHPLSAGEFIAIFLPFAILFFLQAKEFAGRFVWLAAAAVMFLGALATSSRGALLAIVVSGGITLIILMVRAVQRSISDQFKPFVGLAVLGLVVVTPIGLHGAQQMISGDGGQSTSNSSQARLDQIEMALPKIAKRPVGGYGTGRAARILGYWGKSLTIDNYYLSLALDLGIPGPVVFISILGTIIVVSWRRSGQGSVEDQVLFVGIIASMVAFATTRSIVSMAGNFAFIYIMWGAFAGVGVRLNVPPKKQLLTGG